MSALGHRHEASWSIQSDESREPNDRLVERIDSKDFLLYDKGEVARVIAKFVS